MGRDLKVGGLWVPLVTPFANGAFDPDSLGRLVREIEPYVDGFVPCLSSGEGGKLDDRLWGEVVRTVRASTQKPVAVGVLRPSLEEVAALSAEARRLGCVAVAVPLRGESAEAQKNFCGEISGRSALPIILYNTELTHIDDLGLLREVDRHPEIVALKDSSRNQRFFDEAVAARRAGEIGLAILQGMENQLLASAGCDGFLIALANVEPALCRSMLDAPSADAEALVMAKWDELGLAAESWYRGIKEALVARGTIRSSELVR